MKFKKVLLPFFAGALALSLAACGGDDKAKDKDKDKEETPDTEVSQEDQEAAAEKMQAKLAEQQVEEDLVVAIVNKEELLGQQYNAALSSIQGQMQQMGSDPTSEEAAEQIKTQTLDTVVNQALILQKAKEEKIEVSQEEIDEEYAGFIAQFGDEDTFKKALEEQNMNVDDFKEQIEDSILFDKYKEKVSPAEEISDEEVKEYYEGIEAQNKDGEEGLPPLEEVSEEIKGILAQNKQQEQLNAHVLELQEAADIELKI